MIYVLISSLVNQTPAFCSAGCTPPVMWKAEMTNITIFDIRALVFCLYSIVLDVLLAGTSTTSSNIFLMVLCTIWHESVAVYKNCATFFFFFFYKF